MPGEKKVITTAPGGREHIPVDDTGLVQRKNFDKLNMNGATPVKSVGSKKK